MWSSDKRIKIFCLQFADVVVVVADTAEGLKKMLRYLEKFSEECGVKTNGTKTNAMIFK